MLGISLASAQGMRTQPYRQHLGKLGEDLACEELQRRGYGILARRYRTRFGELDIICAHLGVVVFVEVKARRTARFGQAAEQIPMWKRRRMAAMALDYLAWAGKLSHRCRFDVVAIDGIETARQRIRVIQDAFPVH